MPKKCKNDVSQLNGTTAGSGYWETRLSKNRKAKGGLDGAAGPTVSAEEEDHGQYHQAPGLAFESPLAWPLLSSSAVLAAYEEIKEKGKNHIRKKENNK